MKKILGISAFYHDSAAALLIDGEIVAAAQEERFTRIKHTPEFPGNAIRYCLEYSGVTIDELDAVVFGSFMASTLEPDVGEILNRKVKN